MHPEMSWLEMPSCAQSGADVRYGCVHRVGTEVPARRMRVNVNIPTTGVSVCICRERQFMYPFFGPKARTEDLVITTTCTEVLVYDTQVHHIHHLNDVSRVVWNLCNGRRPPAELRRLAEQQLGVSLHEDTIRDALTKLHDARLLKEPLPPELHLQRTSRRGFTKRSAAGAVAIITSISAPSAAAAQSTGSSSLPCTQGATCFPVSGCCSSYECVKNTNEMFDDTYWCM